MELLNWKIVPIIKRYFRLNYILVAAKKNHFDIVELLIGVKSLNVDIEDNDGLTALMWGILLLFILNAFITLIWILFEAIEKNNIEVAFALIDVIRTDFNKQALKHNNDTSLILGIVIFVSFWFVKMQFLKHQGRTFGKLFMNY